MWLFTWGAKRYAECIFIFNINIDKVSPFEKMGDAVLQATKWADWATFHIVWSPIP